MNSNAKQTDQKAFVLKLAVISFTEYDAKIDNWSDRELIPRLGLVVSLVEAHEEEEIPDDGGV